ncbi:hypothetical protein WEI85_46725 [Actinomycetes bacterium KLBMP 9797]
MVGELRNETVVSEPRWVWPLIWISFPVLGAGVGWLLTLAAGWVADLPAAPFQGVFEAVDGMAEPYATAVALGVGLLAGLALAYLGAREVLTVTVSGAEVTLARGDGSTRSVTRTAVAVAYLDGKQLVLLGRAGEELAREKSDLDGSGLREALREYGYPWHDGGDPYRDEYRRWVPDTPDLPPGADALLKARAKALEKGDGDDAADLRAELGKLGVVVRDEKKRQYWRAVRS